MSGNSELLTVKERTAVRLPVAFQIQEDVFARVQRRTGQNVRRVMVPQKEVDRIVYVEEGPKTSKRPYISPQSGVSYPKPLKARLTAVRTEDYEGYGAQFVDMRVTGLARLAHGLVGLFGGAPKVSVTTRITPTPIEESDMVARKTYQEYGRGPVTSRGYSDYGGSGSGKSPEAWSPLQPAQDFRSRLGRALRSSITGK